MIELLDDFRAGVLVRVGARVSRVLTLNIEVERLGYTDGGCGWDCRDGSGNNEALRVEGGLPERIVRSTYF